MRVLKNDVSRYMEMDEDDIVEEEGGWKLIHGDVFRFPQVGHWGVLDVGVSCGSTLCVDVFRQQRRQASCIQFNEQETKRAHPLPVLRLCPPSPHPTPPLTNQTAGEPLRGLHGLGRPPLRHHSHPPLLRPRRRLPRHQARCVMKTTNDQQNKMDGRRSSS